MSELIRVPDIGNGEGEVIELLVKVGDAIEADQSLLTLESDKASMEIPAPRAGVVSRLLVKLGDRLKEGDPLLELQAADTQPATAASTTQTAAPAAHDDLTPAAQPVAPSEVGEQGVVGTSDEGGGLGVGGGFAGRWPAARCLVR